jgi:hypothetical protein
MSSQKLRFILNIIFIFLFLIYINSKFIANFGFAGNKVNFNILNIEINTFLTKIFLG